MFPVIDSPRVLALYPLTSFISAQRGMPSLLLPLSRRCLLRVHHARQAGRKKISNINVFCVPLLLCHLGQYMLLILLFRRVQKSRLRTSMCFCCHPGGTLLWSSICIVVVLYFTATRVPVPVKTTSRVGLFTNLL
ncbi:hypothetical protein B9Z19DRAFT_1090533, partial [Tuber borchii]